MSSPPGSWASFNMQDPYLSGGSLVHSMQQANPGIDDPVPRHCDCHNSQSLSKRTFSEDIQRVDERAMRVEVSKLRNRKSRRVTWRGHGQSVIAPAGRI
jgi:hypothetical protein